MALVKATLQAALLDIFENLPETSDEAGQRWGSAVGSYGSSVTPPTTAGASAQTALEGALKGAFADPNVDAAPLMETAFTAYGAAIGAGMAPAFTATPPPGPVGFADLFSGTTGDTSQAANDIATKIDTWMRTGIAIPVPPGPSVPWS